MFKILCSHLSQALSTAWALGICLQWLCHNPTLAGMEVRALPSVNLVYIGDNAVEDEHVIQSFRQLN